ncbi:MAG: hypothetical protein CL843_00595 [Crocinitomicaceae bacterium]|nr:hypothetical protein [Crocinitomicaceae bacterium]|tara:strand:- start:2696 stop:3256 length:561 start_codon:yes stop_codon:yes gene_type:complete
MNKKLITASLAAMVCFMSFSSCSKEENSKENQSNGEKVFNYDVILVNGRIYTRDGDEYILFGYYTRTFYDNWFLTGCELPAGSCLPDVIIGGINDPDDPTNIITPEADPEYTEGLVEAVNNGSDAVIDWYTDFGAEALSLPQTVENDLYNGVVTIKGFEMEDGNVMYGIVNINATDPLDVPDYTWE